LLLCKDSDGNYYARGDAGFVELGKAPEDIGGNRAAKIELVESGGKDGDDQFSRFIVIDGDKITHGRFDPDLPAKVKAQNKRARELAKKLSADAPAPDPGTDGTPDMEEPAEDLAKKTKAELAEIVEAEELDVDVKLKKADLITAIEDARAAGPSA